MAIRKTITVSQSGSQTKNSDVYTPDTTQSLTYSYSAALQNGTTNDADQDYTVTYDLTSPQTVNVDLVGALEDHFGDTITPTKLISIMIRNKETASGSDITVGGTALTAGGTDKVLSASATIRVGPSGVLLLVNPVDGYDLTASTGDVLSITSVVASTSVDVILTFRT